jgi:hypothetical protein
VRLPTATTLVRGRGRFGGVSEGVLAAGFSLAFLRMRDLYLAYSQAGLVRRA